MCVRNDYTLCTTTNFRDRTENDFKNITIQKRSLLRSLKKSFNAKKLIRAIHIQTCT